MWGGGGGGGGGGGQEESDRGIERGGEREKRQPKEHIIKFQVLLCAEFTDGIQLPTSVTSHIIGHFSSKKQLILPNLMRAAGKR